MNQSYLQNENKSIGHSLYFEALIWPKLCFGWPWLDLSIRSKLIVAKIGVNQSCLQNENKSIEHSL
jgi:hypothetical protein